MAIKCADFGVKCWFGSNFRNDASMKVRIFTIRCSSGAAATSTALGKTLIFSSPFVVCLFFLCHDWMRMFFS